MRHILALCALVLCPTLCAPPGEAAEKVIRRPDAAHTFATLPADTRFPEGITADPATGDVFVATFDTGSGVNALLRYDKQGHLEARRDFGAAAMLGLAFHPGSAAVYIANFGLSKVQRVAAGFDAATTVVDVAEVPTIGPPPNRTVSNPDGSSDTIMFGANFKAPNSLLFDAAGHLYVSDSFQGAVFVIRNAATCATPCAVETFVHNGLLATAGFPPFGANGLALGAGETTLYVANTGDDRILAVDMVTRSVSTFAESINGADGIAFDDSGRLWVAANQADEVVALNASAQVVARLGQFKSVRADGSVAGLLFPASLVIVGQRMYVTNAALPLPGAMEPEASVTRYTVSRMTLP